eukprot:384239_1
MSWKDIALQENFDRLGTSIRTHNRIIVLNPYPVALCDYSRTEFREYLLPKIKNACLMDRIPKYRAKRGHTNWKFRYLLEKEIINLFSNEFLIKMRDCSSKGILKGVLELPDSMIDSSVPLHPILQEQPWNIANETYRHKKYRSRENLYKKAAEHYHVKMSNVMVKYDVPHTHLCDDLPMFYSREDYKCIKGL